MKLIKTKEAWSKKYSVDRIDIYKALFLVLNTVGLGITNWKDHEMARKPVVMFNMTVIALHVLCHIIIEFDGSLVPHATYNLITKVVFWILHYSKLIYVLLMSVRMLKKRKQIYNCYASLNDITKEMKKLDLKTDYSYKFLKLALVILYGSFPFVMILDIFKHRGDFTICTLWCFYVPPLAIFLHMLLVCLLFTTCSHRFQAINEYLDQFTLSELTTTERIALTMRNLDPAVMNSKFAKNNGNLKQIFTLHDRLCKVVKKVNNSLGWEILLFMSIASLATLHVLYTSLIDLFRIRRGIKVHFRNTFASDYWGFVYMHSILLVTYVASQVMKHGNDTSSGLHTMRSIFPKLNDIVNTFSFQLMHEELDINAAGFFTINFTALYGFVGTLGTYLFILVQLDSGVSEYL